MAKKYEFRPDKSGKGLLSRLHLTQQQRKTLLKWVLYGLFLTFTSVIQDVILARLDIGGATTDLVPCGIILITLAEGTDTGSVFALVASLLYLFSGTAPGPYAMVFITFLAVIVTAFRQAYLQKTFGAAMLCTVVAVAVYELAIFGIGLFLQVTTLKYLQAFLLTAGLTLVVAPLQYVFVRAINKIGGDLWTE